MGTKLQSLIDPKLLKIVKLFLKNPEKIYHLQQISQETKVSTGTTFRLVNELKKSKILKTITIGKTKLYTLDPESKELEVLK